MAHSVLPTWPFILFVILEPISLFAGWAKAIFDTTNFVAEQLPGSSEGLLQSPHSWVLAQQLGNLYGLMCILALCGIRTSRDATFVRNYLICLAIADIGHVAPTLLAMGWENAMNIKNWNAMAYGNIGATVFLFTNRLAYLLGLYGTGHDRRVKSA